jgi:short-subunit dehydrogenase
LQNYYKKKYSVINASRTDSGTIKNKKYYFFKTDVSKEKEVKSLFDSINNKFWKIDLLVNNAGFGRFGKLADTKTKDFDVYLM